jgi:hypothetical protein
MNANDVKSTLYRALEEAVNGGSHDTETKALVDFVLDNTHLTYKYILVTALAAKATDDSINPLSLQAGSSLPGAYDARSICHGAIVEFEKEELGKALGGSNEPFLNKPARFPELSKSNAVRKGRDRQILNALCEGLPEIKTSKEAYDGLVYTLQKLLKVKKRKESLTWFFIQQPEHIPARLVRFIDKLLDKNLEGEILTLTTAGLYEQYMSNTSADYKVEVHPVNQSGASSKEVSDLDIYKNGKLFIANELKDKDFTGTDIRHAADKAIAVGQTQMHFIFGRHGVPDESGSVESCVSEYLANGFVINVVPVTSFILTLVSLIDKLDTDRYVKYMLQTAIDTKFKEDTISFIKDTAEKEFGSEWAEY